jgi:hypothetical protein
MTNETPRRAERFHAGDTRGNIAFRPFRLIDLSDIGARIETTAWVAPGREYLLRVDDPAFQISGRVAWARVKRFDPATGAAVFEAGLEFGEPSPAARAELTRLMARLTVRVPSDELPVLQAEAR